MAHNSTISTGLNVVEFLAPFLEDPAPIFDKTEEKELFQEEKLLKVEGWTFLPLLKWDPIVPDVVSHLPM